MDKLITKQQMKVILQEAPKGSDGGKIVQLFADRGYKIEGFNDQPAPVAKPSSYDVAMGRKNKDGTPNTGNNPISAIGDAIKGGVSQAKEGYNQAKNATNPLQLLEGGTKLAAGVVNTAFSPLAPVVKPIGDAVNAVANKVSDIPAVQKFAMNKTGEITLRAVEDINNLNTVVGAVAGNEASAPLSKNITDIKSGITDTGKSIKENAINLGNKIESVGTKSPADIQANLESSAIKDATPAYNKKLIGGKNQINEVKGVNPLKQREVVPTDSNIIAGKELSKVKGYNPKGTALEKYNTVSSDISNKGEAFDTSLKTETVRVPRQSTVYTVSNAINKVIDENVLLSKADPIVKNYIRVTKNLASKADETLAGVRKVQKGLDNAYEKAGGKYSNNKALDEVHRAARNALIDKMESTAQNTEVKASLKEMRNLYNANDVLKDKAMAEGGSKWEQFSKNHPVIKNTGETALKAVGLGTGLHLVP